MITSWLYFFAGCLLAKQCLGLPTLKSDFIGQVLESEDAANCVTVLLALDTEEVEAIASRSKYPLVIISNKTDSSLSDLLSARNSRCVVLFTDDSIKMKTAERMLVETRHRKIFVLTENVTDLTETKMSPLRDDIIFVSLLPSGKVLLQSHCSTSNHSKSTIWNKDPISLCTSRSLKGRKDISVSIAQLFPFVLYLPNHRYKGAEVEIFNIVADKVGFEYVAREEQIWLRKNTVTHKWEGIVGSVINGTSEFGFSGLAINRPEDRSTFPLDFSPQLFTMDVIYLCPIPQPLHPFLNFLKPFTWPVWLCLFGALLLSALACSLLISFRQSKYFKHDKELRLGRLLLDLFGTMCSQNLVDTCKSPSISIFYLVYGFWIIALFFKTSAYNCNLRAFIVKKDYEKPIETDEDVVRMDKDAYFPIGGVPTQYYLTSPLAIKQKIMERAVARGTVYDVSSGDMKLPIQQRMVREKSCRNSLASRASFLLANLESNFGYQPLRAGKAVVLNWGVAFVMPMYRPWSEEINRMLLRINNAGIVDHLIDKSTPRNKYMFPEVRKREEDLEPYQVEHVAGSLIFLVGGLVISFTAFCSEHFMEKWKKV